MLSNGFPLALVLRVFLLCRLLLPSPTLRTCWCGRQLDVFGHRAACAKLGVLGRRGFALESTAARVCVWWTSLHERSDSRAIDTTLVSLLSRDGVRTSASRGKTPQGTLISRMDLRLRPHAPGCACQRWEADGLRRAGSSSNNWPWPKPAGSRACEGGVVVASGVQLSTFLRPLPIGATHTETQRNTETQTHTQHTLRQRERHTQRERHRDTKRERERVLARMEMTKNGAEPGRSRTRNSHLKSLQYNLRD